MLNIKISFNFNISYIYIPYECSRISYLLSDGAEMILSIHSSHHFSSPLYKWRNTPLARCRSTQPTHLGRNTWRSLQKTMAILMLVKGVNTSLSVRDASQYDPPNHSKSTVKLPSVPTEVQTSTSVTDSVVVHV